MPEPDDIVERAALMEIEGGLPRHWAESLARLSLAEKPFGYEDERWSTIVKDAHELVIPHVSRLESVGWTPGDVKGLFPLLKGRKVLAIGLGEVSVQEPGGNKVRIYLRPRPGAAPRWDEGRRLA
ncbi:hypothetical protein [Azospirillum sp. SYSU D00513]|uniref:hypothetical protein n=1 Tax=Azospirillum sp. SYSU D00513 TaxID=2812561 RepID=UPI001A95C707|nr:hypothetical protein [Azospirillum sp. SYSU D00513]